MNGLRANTAAAMSPARSPTALRPTMKTSGIDAIPPIIAGRRISSGAEPSLVENQAKTKYSGGEISASLETTSRTWRSPPPSTM